jgi:hypothetical protein
MADAPLADWPRQHFAPGGSDPFLFYVVFGQVETARPLSRVRYRCEGIPDGLQVSAFGPGSHPEVAGTFREGYLWEQLRVESPTFAKTVAEQDSCVILQGGPNDPATLNYFRDAVGLLQFFLDAGGVALYDPQMFQWWSPDEWRSRVFDSGSASPRRHVTILVSEDEDGTRWVHTRGMRKFGRPDLSVRRTPPPLFDAVVELCDRFIEFQAFGAQIGEGQPIRLHSLPDGMRCFRRGHVDDPDFNNEHIEIAWPPAALLPD